MRKLKDIMTSRVETLTPQATIKQAAAKMKSLDVGVIPVCEGNKILGMLTDRDLVIRGLARGKDIETTKISELMSSSPVVYCYDTDSVKNAAKLMQKKQIRRIPVLDRKKNLVGIVSLGDLATEAGDAKLTGKTLKGVSGSGFGIPRLGSFAGLGLMAVGLAGIYSYFGGGKGIKDLIGSFSEKVNSLKGASQEKAA